MKKITLKLKKIATKLLHFFPHQLPVGVTAFNKLFQSLTATYDFPDASSYKHAVASSIMHLGQTTDSKAPRFFAKTIRKAMANQIAYNVIEEIRVLDKAEQIKQAATLQKSEPAECPETTQN